MDSPETPIEPAPPRRIRVATVLAGVALGALVVSALLFTLPVKNPDVQSCGAPAAFLLQATSDRPLVDPDGTVINGWDVEADRDRIEAAQDNPCSDRVARRAVPAAGFLLAFTLLTPTALIIGWTGRRKQHQH